MYKNLSCKIDGLLRCIQIIELLKDLLQIRHSQSEQFFKHGTIHISFVAQHGFGIRLQLLLNHLFCKFQFLCPELLQKLFLQILVGFKYTQQPFFKRFRLNTIQRNPFFLFRQLLE